MTGVSNDQRFPSRCRRTLTPVGAAVCRFTERASNTGIEKIVSERSWSKGTARLSARDRSTTWMRSLSGESR